MKIFSNFKQLPKRAVYILVGLFVVGLFAVHIIYINKITAHQIANYQRQRSLEVEILKEVYPDPTERESHYASNEVIEKSRLANEYRETEARADQLRNAMNLYILLALFGWPTVLLLVTGIAVRHYWKGKGLDEQSLQARQNRVRAIGTILIAAFLTLLMIIWRFVASQQISPVKGLIYVAFFVAVVGCGFVSALWGLMASSLSRLSPTMKSAPHSYRIALLAAVVAGVAFVTVSDLNDFAHELRVDSLILIGVQSSAWLATIISIGSVMLGYMRLPDEKHKREAEQKQAQGAAVLQPKQDGSDTTVTKPSPNSVIDLAKVYERVSAVASLLESSNHRTADGAGQTNKKQRAQRSDEIVRIRGDAVRQRLLIEVQSLTRRGNLNLTIGSLTSLIAATILWMLVAQAPTSVPGTTALVGYYVPRLSVAVFIEVFSFFFLRLYKNGLSEIMYYQNELTNLESKMLALEIASQLTSTDSLQQILQDLAKTDRNMILKSGESTVELEKIKVDQQNVQSLFDSLIAKITDVKDALTVGK